MNWLNRWVPAINLVLFGGFFGGFLWWAAAPKYSYTFDNGQLTGVQISRPLSSECRYLSYYRFNGSNGPRREYVSCYQHVDEDVEVNAELEVTRTAPPQTTITSVMINDNGVRTTYDTPKALENHQEVVQKAKQVLSLGRTKFSQAQDNEVSILAEAHRTN